jgi:hypothetical protein
VDFFELRPIVARQFQVDCRGLSPDITTFYLHENINAPSSDFIGNELSAQVLEIEVILRNSHGNVKLFGVKGADFNVYGVPAAFFSAAAKSGHAIDQG